MQHWILNQVDCGKCGESYKTKQPAYDYELCADCYEEEYERIVGLDLEDALLKLIYNTLQN